MSGGRIGQSAGAWVRGLFGAAPGPKQGPLTAASDDARAGFQYSDSRISYATLRQMHRDPTVASSLEVAKVGMVPGVQLQAGGTDARADRALTVCRAALDVMPGNLIGILHKLLDEALETGMAIAEPMMMLGPGGVRTFAWVRVRKTESFEGGIQASEYGDVEAFRQHGAAGGCTINAADLIYWPYRGSDYDYYGRSAYYEAHDHWKAKVHFLRAWAVYLQRHGMGVDVLQSPDDTFAADHDRAMDILDNLQEQSGVHLPMSNKYELHESGGTPGNAYATYYETCNKGIRQAILCQELATAESMKVGSYAAAKVQGDVMWSVLRTRGEIFCEAMREQLLARLLRWNGLDGYPVPFIVPEPVEGPPSVAELLMALTPAISSGVLPALTPEQAAALLERWGFKAEAQRDREVDEQEAPSLNAAARVHGSAKKGREDYSAYRREWDRREQDGAAAASLIWSRDLQPQIAQQITVGLFDRNGGWKTRDYGAIRNLIGDAVGRGSDRIKASLLDAVMGMYEYGKAASKAVIEAHRTKSVQAAIHVGNVLVTPTQALQKYAASIANSQDQRIAALRAQIYGIVTDAITGNRTPEEVGASLFDVLASQGYSLEQCRTILRTEQAMAWNEGRMSVFRDLETKVGWSETTAGVIVGYRHVSVLDAGTTPECEQRDGWVFSPADVIVPPLHYGCRSTLEPVFAEDTDGIDVWTRGSGPVLPAPQFPK